MSLFHSYIILMKLFNFATLNVANNCRCCIVMSCVCVRCCSKWFEQLSNRMYTSYTSRGRQNQFGRLHGDGFVERRGVCRSAGHGRVGRGRRDMPLRHRSQSRHRSRAALRRRHLRHRSRSAFAHIRLVAAILLI